jgi:hypothetical protein
MYRPPAVTKALGHCRHFRRLCLLIAIAVVLSACSQVRTAPASKPDLDISGLWEGTTKITPCGPMADAESVCNAVNRIVLSLDVSSSQIRGTYRCDYGNYICRDNGIARSGYVANGSISGSRVQLRIIIPADVSSCMYFGSFSPDKAAGRYTCFAGGGIVEQGIWQVIRLY